MINLELARIEKMLKMINRNNEIALKNISNIKIEKFVNQAFMTVSSDNDSEIFILLRKDFEDKYSLKWGD